MGGTESLSPPMQLAAWEDLLRLAPPRSMVTLWLPRFEELHRNHPSLPGIARVAAQLHQLADSPEAQRLAQAWIVEARGDPEAQLCRMRMWLRKGALQEACDDAIVAVQEAVDPGEALAVVVAVCQEAMREQAPGAAEAARLLVHQFQSLQLDRVDAGGRR